MEDTQNLEEELERVTNELAELEVSSAEKIQELNDKINVLEEELSVLKQSTEDILAEKLVNLYRDNNNKLRHLISAIALKELPMVKVIKEESEYWCANYNKGNK